MTKTKLLLSVAAASVLALNGCIDITRNDTLNVNYTDTGGGNGGATGFCTVDNTIAGFVTTNLVLTQDTCIDGQIQVKKGASITAKDITIAAVADSDAWIEVLPGAKIFAENVLFTSEEEVSGGTGSAGQWGGVTLIGNDNTNEEGTAINTQLKPYEVDGVIAGGSTTTLTADSDMNDSSGSLINCTLNNTGVDTDTLTVEINGLSLVGVGADTQIDGITVNRAGDDGVEIWGGHVNLTNVTIAGSGDDGFDTDDGWAGSVVGLTVSGVTNSGLELSGDTHATYTHVSIDTTGQTAVDDKGGAIYLKQTKIGGFFTDVNITDNPDNTDYGAFVIGDVDINNTAGSGINISGPNPTEYITTTSDYDGNPSILEVADKLGITLKY